MKHRFRIIATALVALSVLAAGAAYLVLRTPAYRSEAKVALVPQDASPSATLLRSFERSSTLGTYVEAIASPATLLRAGSPPVRLVATAVPESRVIRVAAYGDEPVVRPALQASLAATQASPTVRDDPWRLAALDRPSAAAQAGPGTGRFVAMIALLAVVGAVVTFLVTGRLVAPSAPADERRRPEAPPAPIGIGTRLTGGSGNALMAGGLALAAGAACLAMLAILGADEGRFPVLAAAALGAAILTARPSWLVPAFIALTWGSIGTAAAAGAPTPVLLLLPIAFWQAVNRPQMTRRVLLVLALLALPIVATGLLAVDGPVLDPKNLKEMLFLFVVAMVVTSVGAVHSTAVALAVAGLVLGLGAVYSVLAHPLPLFPLSDEPGGMRAAGPFGEPNFFALSLAALLPMAMYVVALGGRMQILGAATGMSLVAGVFATGSRGGLLAAGVAIVVFGALTRLPRLRIGAAVTVIAALAVAPLFGAQTAAFGERTVEGRATENLVALAMFSDHPVVGVGPGQYRHLYRDYTRDVGDDDRYLRFAHSLPLELAAEQGIAGLAGWLAAGAAIVGYALKRGVWKLLLGRALMLSAATYLLGSLFLHGAQIRLLFMLAALVLALAASLPRPLGEAR